MEKLFRTAGIIVVMVGLINILSFFSYSETDDIQFQQTFNKDYRIYALNLPEDLTFMGDDVPFDDPDIYERFDRELMVNTYWQSQTLLFFKRSSRYFPIIEPILKKHGIPEDFKYLPLIESGFMNVVSPAGAVGFWQLMEAAGKETGLEIKKEVDERYHLEKSTEAACKYLKQAYKEFGNWTMAAASYNMGMGGLKKQIKRQKASNYYDLTLNSETSRYIFRIMAIKEILENPEKYGFTFREKDLYKPIPVNVVKVDTGIAHLGDFAKSLGINYRILKFHNPWLRYEYLPHHHGKTYEIKVPKEGYFELAGEPTDSAAAAEDSLQAQPVDSITTDTLN